MDIAEKYGFLATKTHNLIDGNSTAEKYGILGETLLLNNLSCVAFRAAGIAQPFFASQTPFS